MKEKVAFVVVRYGQNINGGAEFHCRMLAERLTADYDVEVLTTCVNDYVNGGNAFDEGSDVENGVLVRRFKAEPIPCAKLTKGVRRLRMFLYRIHCLEALATVFPRWNWQHRGELADANNSPFYSPSMFNYIRDHKDEYKVIIVFTMYHTPFLYTALLAGEKTIAIPTVHCEKNSFRAILTGAVSRIAYMGFNTGAEERLAKHIFGRALGPHGIIGVGVDVARPADWAATKAKYALPDNYLLYVGRLDVGKLSDLLPEFRYYKTCHPDSKLHLVMVGERFGNVVTADDVVYTGFVSDEEKTVIMEHATVMVNPSRFESLSLILLEALRLGAPMIVNGRCAVLREHSRLSHGAVACYMNRRQFVRRLYEMETSPELRRRMAEEGRRYEADNYNWPLIMSRLKAAIVRVARYGRDGRQA